MAERILKVVAVVGELSFQPYKRGESCATGQLFSFFIPVRREKSERELFILSFKGHGEHSFENTT